jgi:sec-independent protein translocase protein TatA
MVYPIAIGMPGGAEWIIIAAIGLLLFGKRLPEVGRSLGKGIVEFKKGLKGVEEEVEQASDHPAAATDQPADDGDAGVAVAVIEPASV